MIIVWKLDRFARNRYDSAYYKSLLKKNGVKVVSAKESIADGSDGKQRMIDGFINSIYFYDDKITFTFNYKEDTKMVVFNELETAECLDMKCLGIPEKSTS